MRPKRSRQASNARSTSSACATSHWTPRPRSPSAGAASRARSPSSLRDRDARALARVALRDRAPEPAAAAGDERDTPGQPPVPVMASLRARARRARGAAACRTAIRDRVDQLAGAHLHVRRHAGGDERHDLGGIQRLARTRDDERLRHLTGLLVADRHHAGVGDLRVREQDALELGRRHLVALVLDQLLEAIHDAEAAGLVDGRDVARAQPAVCA